MIDEEAEAVRDQTLSDGYSASEPLDDSDQAQRHDQTEIQAWEDVGLEYADEMGEQHVDSNQGGRSHHIYFKLLPLQQMMMWVAMKTWNSL